MPNFIFANNVDTTLASPITSSGQTTIVLSSTANLPTIAAGQTWALTLNDAATNLVFEIVYVTARTGATLTVLRGQEGTAATTWLAGDLAFGSDTAGILASFQTAAGRFGVVPAVPADGSAHVVRIQSQRLWRASRFNCQRLLLRDRKLDLKQFIMAVILALAVTGTASAQTPVPSPTPSAPAPTVTVPPLPVPAPQVTFPGATPAPLYTPVPCVTLIRRAGLVGKKITADALGMILAESLREHGFKSGSVIDRALIGKAVSDFVSCFAPSK